MSSSSRRIAATHRRSRSTPNSAHARRYFTSTSKSPPANPLTVIARSIRDEAIQSHFNFEAVTGAQATASQTAFAISPCFCRLRAGSAARRQHSELLQKRVFVPAQTCFVDLAVSKPQDTNGIRHADRFPAGANIPKRTTMRTVERPAEGHLVCLRDQIVDGQAEIRKRRCVGLQ